MKITALRTVSELELYKTSFLNQTVYFNKTTTI